MATGEQILSYQGSGGLGSSPGVPAIPEKTDWDALNKGVERMLINNADKNRRVYEQKLKDRDKLMQAIDSGDVKVGDILEEDMGWVKEGLSGLDDKFFNRVKVGAKHGMGSNEFIDADREYKKAAREAQDRVTQAGARFIGEKTQMTAIAEEKLPRKKEAMIKNLESWRKNKWGEVAPYQQTLDFDFDKIKGYVKMRTTQGVDPKNPLMKVKTTSADANSTLQEAQKDFLENNEERENQSALLEQYQSLPPAELKEQLTIFNNRLKPLGVQIEFEEFDTPNGKVYAIKDSIPEFAGKWALGVHPQLQSSESEFDKDLGSYKLGQERNRISAANAAANQMRARAYSALQNKKLSQMNDDEKRVKNFWDGVTGKVKSKGYKTADGKIVEKDFVFTGDLPPGYTLLGGVGADGKPIELVPKTLSTGGKYYDTKFYDGSGNEMNLRDQYDAFKKNGGKGSYDDLRNDLLKRGVINMELVGENGVGNFQTAGQATRAISNKGTSKGEEPIFTDEQEEE